MQNNVLPSQGGGAKGAHPSRPIFVSFRCSFGQNNRFVSTSLELAPSLVIPWIRHWQWNFFSSNKTRNSQCFSQSTKPSNKGSRSGTRDSADSKQQPPSLLAPMLPWLPGMITRNAGSVSEGLTFYASVPGPSTCIIKYITSHHPRPSHSRTLTIIQNHPWCRLMPTFNTPIYTNVKRGGKVLDLSWIGVGLHEDCGGCVLLWGTMEGDVMVQGHPPSPSPLLHPNHPPTPGNLTVHWVQFTAVYPVFTRCGEASTTEVLQKPVILQDWPQTSWKRINWTKRLPLPPLHQS